MWTTYLDETLADFSGYVAIDEVYDGPFCVLSVVDDRRYHRLAFRVLDHDPTEDDVRVSLEEFGSQLDERNLEVYGNTTDGSALYPNVLEELWPDARHQICRFHVIKEITRAVLHALVVLREEMTASIPKPPRGRPTKEQEPLVRTALKELARPRRWVRRFEALGQALRKLPSPTLEKALEFLDDKLLGSTSNAVERGNRRFREARKSIYSVRTKEHIEQHLALDMHREQQAPKRQQTMKTLHDSRSKHDCLH